MAYIGKTPTAVPLTSGDITNGIITTAKIADDAISAAKLASGVGGKVVQMVSSSTSSSTTISGTSFTSTSLSANITPTSASNKIIVWCLGGEADTNDATRSMQPSIFRDSTNIGNATSGMNTVYGAGTRLQGNPTVGVVDTPNTTSETTYVLKIKGTVAGNVVFNANTCQATIILMEVTP